MHGFLKRLPLSAEEKEKLDALAVETPAALASLIQANPNAFEDWFGYERTLDILHSLENLISESDREVIDKSHTTSFHKLGAIVERRPPDLQPTVYDIDQRNRLFRELQYLESQSSPSDNVKQRIKQLTKKLNDLLTAQAD